MIIATLHTHYGRMLRLDGAQVGRRGRRPRLLGFRGSTFPARKALDQARRLGPDGRAPRHLVAGRRRSRLKGAIDWSGELVLEVLVARLSRLAPRKRR